MSKENIAFFSLAHSLEEDRERYLEKIARLNKLDPNYVNTDELRNLYSSLVENDIRAEKYHLQKYFGYSEDLQNLPHEIIEMLHRFRSDYEAYEGIYQSVMTYGLCMPSYLEMMKSFSRSHDEPDHHHSLLIGAASAYSIREHAVAVRHSIPHATTTAINLEGYAKDGIDQIRGLNVALADGLHMPFPQKSFDTVHTNMLLTFLREGKNLQSAKTKVPQLLSGIKTVLRPGGAIMMIEYDPQFSTDTYKHRLKKELLDTGYKNIAIHPTTVFRSRRYLGQFMGGTDPRFPKGSTIQNDKLLSVYAEKPRRELYF